jgi:hypothetical protein
MHIVRKGGDGRVQYITNIFVGGDPPHHRGHFNFAIGRPMLKKGVKTMLELNVTNEEKILVSCNPVTPGGHSIELDGPIIVDVQSGDGTAEVQSDGKSVYLFSGDLPGDSTFIIQGDADLGSGVETISDVILLHVAGAKASSFGLSAGPPELK